jgi:hypothetical protein
VVAAGTLIAFLGMILFAVIVYPTAGSARRPPAAAERSLK